MKAQIEIKFETEESTLLTVRQGSGLKRTTGAPRVICLVSMERGGGPISGEASQRKTDNDHVAAGRHPRSRRFPTLPIQALCILACKDGLKAALAESRPGRVILHSLCLLRRPCRFQWHWQGIVREFAH